VIQERAPAKLNLVLHVGAPAGGMHPLCSLFASLELADELEARPLPADSEDAVICAGVDGPNLAAAALAAFRERTVALPPLELRIRKRIPVAGGLGGGSADAAAALRAANRIAAEPLGAEELRALGAELGSDVPSQVQPRHWLVTGTGGELEPVELPALEVVLLPAAEGLGAGEVYAELDRLGAWRERLDPAPLRRLAGAGAEALAAGVENDLEPAALALRPELEATLQALRAAGALAAAVSGSGPTCFGLFADARGADHAAARLDGAVRTRLRQA
jgi:4-diphosphocytidyl-2-C-methyl-D-erythritol kinase